MTFVALEFDHQIAQHSIRWIVIDCAGVGRKCGGPIALSPRHDIGYFLDPMTAEQDALHFAAYKNALAEGAADSYREMDKKISADEHPHYHYPYRWDHLIFSNTIRWAVLKWSGSEQTPSKRVDVAYFVDPETAEHDARAFSFIRESIYANSMG